MHLLIPSVFNLGGWQKNYFFRETSVFQTFQSILKIFNVFPGKNILSEYFFAKTKKDLIKKKKILHTYSNPDKSIVSE